jgi:hypothetical protein
VDAMTASRGERFLAAFNEIEDRFRRVLGLDEHAEFAEMADDTQTRSISRVCNEMHCLPSRPCGTP